MVEHFPISTISSRRSRFDTVSLPIAIGLLAMMYPVLAKVKYRSIGTVVADRRLLVMSLVLNWLIGPANIWCISPCRLG